MCSPRPVSAREPGVRGAGTAVLESATAHSTQRPGWTTPSLSAATAGYRRVGPWRAAARGEQFGHDDRDVQYRPALTNGFLTQTGLPLEPRTGVEVRPQPCTLCNDSAAKRLTYMRWDRTTGLCPVSMKRVRRSMTCGDQDG